MTTHKTRCQHPNHGKNQHRTPDPELDAIMAQLVALGLVRHFVWDGLDCYQTTIEPGTRGGAQ